MKIVNIFGVLKLFKDFVTLSWFHLAVHIIALNVKLRDLLFHFISKFFSIILIIIIWQVILNFDNIMTKNVLVCSL